MVRGYCFATEDDRLLGPSTDGTNAPRRLLSERGQCYDKLQTRNSNLPKLMLPRISYRPISISQIGSRRFMDPIMTSSMLLRTSMILTISSMRLPLLGASIGMFRQMDGFARLDPAMMETCQCTQSEFSSAMLRNL